MRALRDWPGKVAIGFSYLLLNSSPSDPKYQTYLDGYRAIADMTIDVTNETSVERAIAHASAAA